ncbi:trehalose-6-phosphate synthase, partial [Genlisea aurea]
GGRRIVVANKLPLRCISRDSSEGGLRWGFEWDEDALILKLKDGFPPGVDVFYVGCLAVEIDRREEEAVARLLLQEFNCVPTFLHTILYGNFYDGFCKRYLWPVLHYLLPMTAAYGGRFDKEAWNSYVSANQIFAGKVMEILNPEKDYVWIHDYHLMILPTFLRKNCDKVRVGFFLHSPFPSSEIYRTIPVWEEILRGFLNSDLVGFHTYDYARHFLSCCGRLLGIDYKTKRGYIGLEYYGRTVVVKIQPVGIHMGRIRSVMSQPETALKIDKLRKEFRGKTILLGVDDLDLFKGITLKFLAFKQLLSDHPRHRGFAVLVQILNPPRSAGDDVLRLGIQIQNLADEINADYGFPGYIPVVCVPAADKPLSYQDKVAYYAIAECAVVIPIRDGMNLVPYHYTVSREIAPPESTQKPRRSVIIVSEFIGCSPSLSGALRVNPMSIANVAEAMSAAITAPDTDQEARHERHYRYIESHDVTYWSRSFDLDLRRVCFAHLDRTKTVVSSNDLQKLNPAHVKTAYAESRKRVMFFDYDGTLMPQDKSPTPRLLSVLSRLCSDARNTVLVVSGRGKEQLSRWFDGCTNLGLAAEHGFFLSRMPWETRWESMEERSMVVERWRGMVMPILQSYTEGTDGSYMEEKETCVVWHWEEADPEFGWLQGKAMVDELERILAGEGAVVGTGQQTVEVKPREVSKGKVVKKVMGDWRGDFVMCIGDEDMMDIIAYEYDEVEVNNVFRCRVGRKPSSRAMYYLASSMEVVAMLEGLDA